MRPAIFMCLAVLLYKSPTDTLFKVLLHFVPFHRLPKCSSKDPAAPNFPLVLCHQCCVSSMSRRHCWGRSLSPFSHILLWMAFSLRASFTFQIQEAQICGVAPIVLGTTDLCTASTPMASHKPISIPRRADSPCRPAVMHGHLTRLTSGLLVSHSLLDQLLPMFAPPLTLTLVIASRFKSNYHNGFKPLS